MKNVEYFMSKQSKHTQVIRLGRNHVFRRTSVQPRVGFFYDIVDPWLTIVFQWKAWTERNQV